MSTDARIVYCTFPDGQTADNAALKLVSERLVACANVLPEVKSIYRWNHQICTERECLVIFKTTRDRLPALHKSLLALHPYECPEIIATEVVDGHPPYLDWLKTETTNE